MAKYLLVLSPRGPFFFGGDRAFTASGEAVYSASSTNYPQQTAVLGMLRYAIGKQKGFNASEVGYEGFGLTKTQDDAYGKIKNLSAIFIIENKTRYWIPSGLDCQKYLLPEKNEDGSDKLDINGNKIEKEVFVQLSLENTSNKLVLKGFDPKQYTKNRLSPYDSIMLLDDSKAIDDLIVEASKVGNRKERTGMSKAEGFFKQKFKTFARPIKNSYKSPYAFGVYVEYEGELKLGDSVNLGAEDSVFGLEVVQLVNQEKTLFENLQSTEAITDNTKIILLSDTYIPDFELFKVKTEYILGNNIPFRFMKTNLNSAHFTKDFRANESYQLLERGTVIYPKKGELEHVKTIINEQVSFQKIGYNYFRTLNR